MVAVSADGGQINYEFQSAFVVEVEVLSKQWISIFVWRSGNQQNSGALRKTRKIVAAVPLKRLNGKPTKAVSCYRLGFFSRPDSSKYAFKSDAELLHKMSCAITETQAEQCSHVGYPGDVEQTWSDTTPATIVKQYVHLT